MGVIILTVILCLLIAVFIIIGYAKKKGDEIYFKKLTEAEKECNLKTEKLNEAKKEMYEEFDEKVKQGVDIKFNYLINSRKDELDELNHLIEEAKSEVMFLETHFEVDEDITSEEYKNEFSLLSIEEKSLIDFGYAIKITGSHTSKKNQNDNIKQILRCFNSETSVIINNTTIRNVDSSRSKIQKSFEMLNKIFKTDGVELTKDFLEIKLKKLNLKYAQEFQKEQERLQQKAIREQMVEEEKVRREIEREKKKLEKEELHFRTEISRIMKHIENASDIDKDLYMNKLNELNDKLKQVENDMQDVLNREKNTRAGYVYIISNIGSFGENVYKIGMTRRLDPMDRIDELSSASVPFNFDVHAMIFSDDAPGLEKMLHDTFDSKRLNLVNKRKEFFRVSLEEIEEVVKKNYNSTVSFTLVAKAEQYRKTQELLKI